MINKATLKHVKLLCEWTVVLDFIPDLRIRILGNLYDRTRVEVMGTLSIRHVGEQV